MIPSMVYEKKNNISSLVILKIKDESHRSSHWRFGIYSRSMQCTLGVSARKTWCNQRNITFLSKKTRCTDFNRVPCLHKKFMRRKKCGLNIWQFKKRIHTAFKQSGILLLHFRPTALGVFVHGYAKWHAKILQFLQQKECENNRNRTLIADFPMMTTSRRRWWLADDDDQRNMTKQRRTKSTNERCTKGRNCI